MGKIFFRIFTNIHVFFYRLTRGKLAGKVQGLQVLLLTTTGRKTGKQRTTPLGHFMDGDGYVIIASNAGFDSHPDWYHNLKSSPRVTIEVNKQRINVQANIAAAKKRNQLWERLVKLAPGYAGYAKRTRRVIPMIILRPVKNTQETAD